MANSTNFAAGAETTDVVLAYALQNDGLVFPSSGWRALRVTGESFGRQQQTRRELEMGGKRQVSPSFVSQVGAQSGFNFLLSYGTFDDLIAALLGSDWSAALAINGAAADISFAASGNQVTSTTANKFSAILVGQHIRIFGCTASGGQNNGIRRVTAKANNQTLTVTGPLVNETPPGTAVAIRGSMIRNAEDRQLIAFQKQLGPAQFMRYPRGMIGGMTLRGSLGQSFSGAFTILPDDEVKATATAGTVAAAPGGGFFNCVDDFGGLSLDDTAVDAVVQSLDLSIQRSGGAKSYGMGSPAAQGSRFGQVEVSGSVTIVWRSYALYDRAVSEQNGLVTATLRDDAGNAYALSLPSSVLRNGSPQASGPNGDVTSTHQIEGAQDFGSHAFQMDRFAAVP